MDLVDIGISLVVGAAGSIIAADPALNLNKIAHQNARLAVKLIMQDCRQAYENIFLSDLAGFESHTVRFGRSFKFYFAAIRHRIDYKINLVRLEMSLPCCFRECGISSWAGGIEQWEKDALATLDHENIQALAAVSARHSKLVEDIAARITLTASNYRKMQEEEAILNKLFAREKECLARSNIDIYMLLPFPAWAPGGEWSKSRECAEFFDKIRVETRRDDYINFWEQSLSEEKIDFPINPRILSVGNARQTLFILYRRVCSNINNLRSAIERYFRAKSMRLLRVDEPKPIKESLNSVL